MKWYDNSVFTAIIAMTSIACWAMTVMGIGAKEIIIPIVTGVSGFVTGQHYKSNEIS